MISKPKKKNTNFLREFLKKIKKLITIQPSPFLLLPTLGKVWNYQTRVRKKKGKKKKKEKKKKDNILEISKKSLVMKS